MTRLSRALLATNESRSEKRASQPLRRMTAPQSLLTIREPRSGCHRRGECRRHHVHKNSSNHFDTLGGFVSSLACVSAKVESRPLARAIVAYHDQPSAEHQAELERQQSHVRSVRFQTSVFIGVLLAANSFGLVYISRRTRPH